MSIVYTCVCVWVSTFLYVPAFGKRSPRAGLGTQYVDTLLPTSGSTRPTSHHLAYNSRATSFGCKTPRSGPPPSLPSPIPSIILDVGRVHIRPHGHALHPLRRRQADGQTHRAQGHQQNPCRRRRQAIRRPPLTSTMDLHWPAGGSGASRRPGRPCLLAETRRRQPRRTRRAVGHGAI